MMASRALAGVLAMVLILAGAMACSVLFPFDQQLTEDTDADADGDADVDADDDEEGIDPCDLDNDGSRAIGEPCGGNDCDDNDARINPSAAETCNGVDDNCNEAIDETGNVNVSHFDYASTLPSVVWTGSEFGIAWVDMRGSGGSDSATGEIWFARRDRLGGPIGVPREVTTTGEKATQPSLVWSESGYAIAYVVNETTLRANIFFRHLGTDGEGSGEHRLLTESNEQLDGEPVLVWVGGENYALVWQATSGRDAASIWTRRFLRGGSADPPVQVSSSLVAWRPTAAWTGRELGVAWTEGLVSTDIVFRGISAGGVLGSEISATETGGRYTADQPSLAWSGSEFGLAYLEDIEDEGQPRVRFRLVGRGGEMSPMMHVGEPLVFSPSPAPAVAWGGGSFGIAWRQGDNVVMAAFSVDGARMSRVEIVNVNPFESMYPAPVFGEGAFAAAFFQDVPDTGLDVFFAPAVCLGD